MLKPLTKMKINDPSNHKMKKRHKRRNSLKTKGKLKSVAGEEFEREQEEDEKETGRKASQD